MITVFLIVFFMILFMALALSLGKILKKNSDGESCTVEEIAHEKPHSCGLCGQFGTGGCSAQHK